jgi:hypothetical protein
MDLGPDEIVQCYIMGFPLLTHGSWLQVLATSTDDSLFKTCGQAWYNQGSTVVNMHRKRPYSLVQPTFLIYFLLPSCWGWNVLHSNICICFLLPFESLEAGKGAPRQDAKLEFDSHLQYNQLITLGTYDESIFFSLVTFGLVKRYPNLLAFPHNAK